MNANFKPLGLAAAVATATAGYAGVVNAQAQLAGNTQLGDLAIVPYYTVVGDWATGINIINTSERTQVIKFRFRRAPDSMDALDFNVVLSPYDMYTGYLSQTGNGNITWTSNDNSCTAPEYTGPFVMPPIYRNEAETGYVEIISMGSPISETSDIAVYAEHDALGIPEDCEAVRDHFFQGGVVGSARGVVDSVTTVGGAARSYPTVSYEESPDSLKVSYFITDDSTGIEFGNNAVHIANFMDGASMTNQEFGVFSGDLQGFDHPDLNGGAPQSVLDGVSGAASLGLYNDLRAALGADALINDWSRNSGESPRGLFTVDTDWVVTYPGQYVMLNLPIYLAALADAIDGPDDDDVLCLPDLCDYRDIPLTASFTIVDREEQTVIIQEGDLVISPQPPVEIPVDVLDKEVNVIEWGMTPVLDSPFSIGFDEADYPGVFGWAALTATSAADRTQSICEYNGTYDPTSGFPLMDCSTPAVGNAPVVGFVAWQRNFDSAPDANYGRIVEHSRVQSSS